METIAINIASMLDILDDSLEDITNALYSRAYGGRNVLGAYEQPANLLLSTVNNEKSDIHIDLLGASVDEPMAESKYDDWATVFVDGEAVGASTRGPFVYDMRPPDVPGSFSSAVKSLGQALCLTKAAGFETKEVVDWFRASWGVDDKYDFDRFTPSLKGEHTIGMTSLDTVTAPQLKAYPGKGRKVMTQWHGTTRKKLGDRSGRDVAFDFAKAAEVAKYIGCTLSVDGPHQQEMRLDMCVIVQDIPTVFRHIGPPITLCKDKVYEKPPDHVIEFFDAAGRWATLTAAKKLVAERTHVTLAADYVNTLSPSELQDFLNEEKKLPMKGMPDIGKLMMATTHLEDDTFFAREPLPRTNMKEKFNSFRLDLSETAQVFDALLPPNVILPGKFASFEDLSSKKDKEVLRDMLKHRIPLDFFSRLKAAGRLIHNKKAEIIRFVAEMYKFLGYPKHALQHGNDHKAMMQFLDYDNVLEGWVNVLKRVSELRHRHQLEIRFIKTQFCSRMLSQPNFPDALNSFIGDRLKAWTTLYKHRASGYPKRDKTRRIRDQLRGRFLPVLHFMFDENDVCTLDGWHPDGIDVLSMTVHRYLDKRRSHDEKVATPAEIKRWGWDIPTLASEADTRVKPKHTFSAMVADVVSRGHLIADDITKVFVDFRTSFKMRKPYIVPDTVDNKEEADGHIDLAYGSDNEEDLKQAEEESKFSNVDVGDGEEDEIIDDDKEEDFKHVPNNEMVADVLNFDIRANARTHTATSELLAELEDDIGEIFDWQREIVEEKFPDGIPQAEVGDFVNWFMALQPPQGGTKKGQRRTFL